MRLFPVMLVLYLTAPLRAIDVIYPIAVVPHKDSQEIQLYVLHQQGCGLELLLWDCKTGRASQALGSQFTPALVRLLADGSGFSFIDKGRLRIKKFDKRSPKAVDFDDFLYGIAGITWFDSCNAYGSAKIRDRHVIFNVDVQGHINILVQNKTFDCLSPQKIGSDLFYIKRDRTYHYSIVKTLYDVEAISSTIIDFGNIPLIFLSMISNSKGFAIEAPLSVDSTVAAEFVCYCIWSDNEVWRYDKVFTFSIPTWIFIGEHRLYESIIPLLPRSINDTIYYVDSNKQIDKLDIHAYTVSTKQSKCITHALSHHYYFAPCLINNTLFYGGTVVTYDRNISGDITSQNSFLDDDEMLRSKYIYLPRISL